MNIQTQNDADWFVNELVNSLLQAATEALPRKSFSKYTKPYWNDEIKALHKVERNARIEWVKADRPRDRNNKLYSDYKRAKDRFRSAQRRASGEYVDKSIKEMENAAECNLRLFWRLVKRKRSKPNESCVEIILNDQVVSTPDLVLGAFENYYKEVFTPTCDAKFDETFKRELESKFNHIITQSKDDLVSTNNDISDNELDTIVSKLKSCKAPGWDLVQNEHIMYGGTVLKQVLKRLYNSILQHEIIPNSWKRGLIIPIYKGHGKSKAAVENYRPVTLLPVLYKIYEKIIQNRITLYIDINNIAFPNPQQQGFQPMLSCVSTAFVVQEVIQYNMDNGSCTYAAFLDTKRAFDTVWHCALFVKLYELGIRGKLWRIIVEMYRNILSAVNMNKKTSSWFPVLQGVRQGGVLSTFLFLVYLDDLLNELERSKRGSHIGVINCCCPTYADDMVVLANSPDALQFLIKIIYNYYYKYRLELHVIKSCVIVFGKLRAVLNKFIDIKFGTSSIPQKKAVVHLGIQQDATQSTISRTRDVCAKARNAFYAMSDIGVYTGGLNAELSISLYKKVVLPIVTYGCEIWNNLKHDDKHELNKLQHHIVKKVQGFNQYVRSDMCESMVGLYRIDAEIDRRKLLFLRRLCSLASNAVALQILLYKLFLYQDTRTKISGFVLDICQILRKYNLECYLNTYIQTLVFPTKSQWKRIVSESVSSYEQSQWNIRVSSDNDFERFKIIHTEMRVAGIYRITCVTDKNLIAHVARLWVMKPSILRPCHLCNRVVRDILKHLVCDCDYTRPLVNWLLGNIHLNTGIDTFVEFAFCSKEALVTKMLTISLESEVSAEQYAFIANICFKTLKVITSGISLY